MVRNCLLGIEAQCRERRERRLGGHTERRSYRKRKAVRHREERFIATAPNQAWSIDFVADQLHDGTRFRALTILDIYTQEGIAIEAGQSLKGDDVVRVLKRLKWKRGVPKLLFCDNGSEFTSQAMDLWAYQNGVKLDFSRPGKPTDNAFVESFNGTFRAECLNAHWFETLAEAKQLHGAGNTLERGHLASSPVKDYLSARLPPDCWWPGELTH